MTYDGVVQLSVQRFGDKAAHKIPTGSVEDRIVWLQVEATDADGKVYYLSVDPKGFDLEETTDGTASSPSTTGSIPSRLGSRRRLLIRRRQPARPDRVAARNPEEEPRAIAPVLLPPASHAESTRVDSVFVTSRMPSP